MKFWKIFEKISDFYEFPELRKREKTQKKPASLKVENLHVFRENLCTLSKAKKKDGFTKMEMKLDL